MALDLSANEASERAGLCRDAIRNIRRAKDPNPNSSTLVALASALETTVEWLTGGEAPERDASETFVRRQYLPVRYRVGAGIWQEVFDAQHFDEVAPMVASPIYAGHGQWLERVTGDSMNKEYPDGTLVHVVDAGSIGYAPRHGDHVVVQRSSNGGALVERSIKEVEIKPGGKTELWPRSTNPMWNTPIRLGGPNVDSVEVVGLVIGLYRRRM